MNKLVCACRRVRHPAGAHARPSRAAAGARASARARASAAADHYTARGPAVPAAAVATHQPAHESAHDIAGAGAAAGRHANDAARLMRRHRAGALLNVEPPALFLEYRVLGRPAGAPRCSRPARL